MKLMDTPDAQPRALQPGGGVEPTRIPGTVLDKPGDQGLASSHTARVWTLAISRSQV